MKATIHLVLAVALVASSATSANAESYYPRDWGADIAPACSCNYECKVYGYNYWCIANRCIWSTTNQGKTCGGPGGDPGYPIEGGPAYNEAGTSYLDFGPSPYYEGDDPSPYWEGNSGSFEDGGYYPPSPDAGVGNGNGNGNGSNLSERPGCNVAPGGWPSLASLMVLAMLAGLWWLGRRSQRACQSQRRVEK
ncbi:MAG: hypothetical protein KC503_44220 [Myxococcales bacterium]|nr:hypothetical protein [Myxococcales bacterium]